MTPKRRALDLDAFASVAIPQPDPVQLAAGEPSRGRHYRPSRAHKVQIQGYFSPDIRRRLKILAAVEGRTVEDLLEEAISDLLLKHRSS